MIKLLFCTCLKTLGSLNWGILTRRKPSQNCTSSYCLFQVWTVNVCNKMRGRDAHGVAATNNTRCNSIHCGSVQGGCTLIAKPSVDDRPVFSFKDIILTSLSTSKCHPYSLQNESFYDIIIFRQLFKVDCRRAIACGSESSFLWRLS